MRYEGDEVGEAAETSVRRSPRQEPDTRRDSAPAELDRLGTNLHMLDEQVERLRERLQPVLTPARPSPALAGTVHDTDGTSALADRLHAMAEQASAAVAFLSDVTERVDL